MVRKSKITPGQMKQVLSFVRNTLEKMNLDCNQVQLFISDSQRVWKFREDLGAIILKNGIVVNPFCVEQIEQTQFYPKGWKAATVDQQLLKLVGLFPGIDVSQVRGDSAGLVTLPETADGIAILPKLSFLGKLWDIAGPYSSGYAQICKKLFWLIADDRSFHNEEGQMDEQHFRIFAEVREKLQELEAKTPGDVLVEAFNFGSLYAGWSPRAARWEALNNVQLPLITAQVACLLLTMPDRLTHWNQLSIDCFGDEWSVRADDGWCRYPHFYHDGSQVRFLAAHGVSMVTSRSGSPVMFLGECLADEA